MVKRPVLPSSTKDVSSSDTSKQPLLPGKTRTLPDAQKGPWFEGVDAVTALRVYGTDRQFDLPRDRKVFSLGSAPDSDIAIPETFLSRLHCVFERKHDALRVHDQGSHNGTYFAGRRESVFDLRPGATFTAGAIRFLAMNDEMTTAYPVLSEILGSEDERAIRTSTDVDWSPSDVIVTATSGTNIIVTGERGCEQERLARTIHSISLVRGRDIVELSDVPAERVEQRAILDRASRSTLVLTIGAKTAACDEAFVSMLFSPSFQIRVVVIAPTLTKAIHVLGDAHVRPMRPIELRPLMMRTGIIPRLLDRMFIERGSELRFSDINSENQGALLSYSWPDNFTDLRIAADRLVAIARGGSLRSISAGLGVSASSFHYWLNQLGLSLPLVLGA